MPNSNLVDPLLPASRNDQANAPIPEPIPTTIPAASVPPVISEPPVSLPEEQTVDTPRQDAKRDNQFHLDTTKIPLWEETQDIIKRLEGIFNTRVITFHVTRESSLTDEEVTEMYNHLHRIGKIEHLVLVIYGPGGSGKAAYRIVKLLREFANRLTIVTPSIAASAMTMLALGGDEILMGPLSYLTPIDTSIANHPLAPRGPDKRPISVEISQVQKYLELVKSDLYKGNTDFRTTPSSTLSEKVHPLFLGTIQRSLSLSKLLVKGIIQTHIKDEETIRKLVDDLNDKYPTHTYPILREEIEAMGVNVNSLSDEQNIVCQELSAYYNDLGAGRTRVENNVKVTIKRFVFIESLDFRSYVYFQAKDRLVKNRWTKVSSKANYERSTIVTNKKGYKEVRPLTQVQFRKWMKGEEVEVGEE